MRRQLVSVFAAISVLVALAFTIPLALLISRTAEDRAIDAARADVAAVTPVLAAGGSRQQVEVAINFTDAGKAGRMTVVTTSGWALGAQADSPALDRAVESGASHVGSVDGGVEVIGAVATGPGALSAVRVMVTEAALRQGRSTAWLTLAAVTITLVGIAVITADRLARGVVEPTQRLAAVSRRLGQGELDARVEPAGPTELVALGNEVNSLGARISSMLDSERELIAELSHRLRTPLTTLRLRLDQVGDPELAGQLRNDVDQMADAVTDVIRDVRDAAGGTGRCDAADCLRARAAHWAPLAEDQGRSWKCDTGSDAAWVPVAEAELSAAIDALLDNVLSHTPEGTPVAIRLEAGREVVLTVSDGGGGFAASSIEAGISGADSTGLGLSISQRTAESAGGSMKIGASALGGASVSLVFPRFGVG